MGASRLPAACSPIAVDGGGFTSSTLRNRAGSSKSPFVQSAQGSLVKWQLLDDEAVRRAERENKLIFLHVGYRACHFCRLMAIESFANPECAAILNDDFVPVIVDREERPDIDTVYINYVQAISNVGGWPLNLFLTPALEPVFGGTFWSGPDAPRRDDEPPDVLTILRKISHVWRDQETRCRKEATDVLGRLREFAAEGTLGTRTINIWPPLAPLGCITPADELVDEAALDPEPVSSELDLDQLEEACTHIAATYDLVHAGFGQGQKFLTPPKLAFLLRLRLYPKPVVDVVGDAECKRAAEMAIETLRKVRDGSLRDHIGGAGFARCSVTPDWSLPSFDKLVVDNAQLLGLYLDAWSACGATDSSEFFDVVAELVDYLTSEPIALAGGGFASSEAAFSCPRRGDADVREGAWHLWTRREFDSVLDALDKNISPVVASYWDIREGGNVSRDDDHSESFFNQNVPRVVKTPQQLADQFHIPLQTVERYIQTAKEELSGRRARERVRPILDDKIITGWNGLVVSALARAAAALRHVAPRMAQRCLHTAEAAVSFIRRRMWDPKAEVLYRIWHDGRQTEGFADDYAYLVCGLLDLVDATDDVSFLEFADVLQKIQVRLFFHEHAGGFFTTTASSPHSVLRLKDGMDSSLPSINAVSAANMLRLGAYLHDSAFSAHAHASVNAFETEMLQHPWLFPGLLDAVVMARLGVAAHPGYKGSTG